MDKLVGMHQDVVASVKNSFAKESGFHRLISARRGMGKTAILRQLKRELKEDANFLVLFPDEHEVLEIFSGETLARVLGRSLAQVLDEEQKSEQSVSLLKKLGSAPDFPEALRCLKIYALGQQRPIVIFLENIDIVFDSLKELTPLMDILTDNDFRFVCSAGGASIWNWTDQSDKELKLPESLAPLFHQISLRELEIGELQVLCKRLVPHDKDKQAHTTGKKARDDFALYMSEVCHLFTGGHPSAAISFFQQLVPSPAMTKGQFLEALETWMSQRGETYSVEMVHLPPRERATLAALASAPYTPGELPALTIGEIASRGQLDDRATSAHVRRLRDKGFVERATEESRRGSRFQVRDPLLRLWYVSQRDFSIIKSFFAMWDSRRTPPVFFAPEQVADSGDSGLIDDARDCIGNINEAFESGNTKEAESKALAVVAELRDAEDIELRKTLAVCLHNLITIEIRLDKLEEAEKFLTMLQGISAALDDSQVYENYRSGLLNLAAAYRDTEHIEKSLSLLGHLPDSLELGRCYYKLGMKAKDEKLTEEAFAHFREGVNAKVEGRSERELAYGWFDYQHLLSAQTTTRLDAIQEQIKFLRHFADCGKEEIRKLVIGVLYEGVKNLLLAAKPDASETTQFQGLLREYDATNEPGWSISFHSTVLLGLVSDELDDDEDEALRLYRGTFGAAALSSRKQAEFTELYEQSRIHTDILAALLQAQQNEDDLEAAFWVEQHWIPRLLRMPPEAVNHYFLEKALYALHIAFPKKSVVSWLQKLVSARLPQLRNANFHIWIADNTKLVPEELRTIIEPFLEEIRTNERAQLIRKYRKELNQIWLNSVSFDFPITPFLKN